MLKKIVCTHERVLLDVASESEHKNRLTATCMDCGRRVDVSRVVTELKSKATPRLRSQGLAPVSGFAL
jgi:hypothetical protein